MRSIRSLGVALIAVLAVAALGASTASATRLCNSATAPCPVANIVPSGTTITASLRSGGTARLVTAGAVINPTITCTASTVTLRTTDAGGGSGVNLNGSVAAGAITFSGCTSTTPSGCDTSITNTNGSTGFLRWTSGVRADLTVTAPTFPVTCPLQGVGTRIVCSYGGNSVTGAFSGGTIGPAATASVTYTSAAINASGGASCPTSARWTATYRVDTVSGQAAGSLLDAADKAVGD
jgi:hypothetical protein